MRQQIQTTSETADATMGTYYCLYRRSTHKKVGRSFKQPWTNRIPVHGQTADTSLWTGRRHQSSNRQQIQSMDRQETPVHGQRGDDSPWTDRRHQSMDRQEAPVHGQTGDTVHGQTGDTRPWTERR